MFLRPEEMNKGMSTSNDSIDPPYKLLLLLLLRFLFIFSRVLRIIAVSQSCEPKTGAIQTEVAGNLRRTSALRLFIDSIDWQTAV